MRMISFDVWSTLVFNNEQFRQAQLELTRRAIGFNGELSELKALTKQVEAGIDQETEELGLQFGLSEHIARLVRLAGVPMLSTSALADLKANLDEARLTNIPQLTERLLPVIFIALRKRGFRLAVICNTSTTEGVIVHKVLAYHRLAQYLDYAIYSDQAGYSKPDPRIFAELVNRSGIAPAHITHIGDNKVTDYQGALSAGFGAILYDQKQRQPESSNVIWSHARLLALTTKE